MSALCKHLADLADANKGGFVLIIDEAHLSFGTVFGDNFWTDLLKSTLPNHPKLRVLIASTRTFAKVGESPATLSEVPTFTTTDFLLDSATAERFMLRLGKWLGYEPLCEAGVHKTLYEFTRGHLGPIVAAFKHFACQMEMC